MLKLNHSRRLIKTTPIGRYKNPESRVSRRNRAMRRLWWLQVFEVETARDVGVTAKVYINAQTDVFTYTKYIQNVQIIR